MTLERLTFERAGVSGIRRTDFRKFFQSNFQRNLAHVPKTGKINGLGWPISRLEPHGTGRHADQRSG
jgi:hypothetical protein